MAAPHPALIELAAGRALPAVGDAPRLVESAREHKMHGLLWEAVRAGYSSLSRDAEMTLAKLQLLTQARHQRLWESLEQATLRLGEVGIAVATAKGVTAEARWYPGIGTRPSVDVDLLLSPRDVSRAHAAVEAIHAGHPLHPQVSSLALKGDLQSIDLIDKVGTHIDLHFDILKWEVESRQNQVIWDRTRVVESANGVEIRVLDAEMSLILFLLHMNKDRFSYLLGYADVARLVGKEDLDWDLVDRFITTEGLEAHLYMTLDAVMTKLDLPNPVHRRPSGWRARAWSRLWPPSIRLRGDLGIASYHRRQYWIGMTARGRSVEAVRRWLRRLFPPRPLLDYYHPGFSGPYLWHLARGRISAARARRDVMSRLG